MVALLVEGFGGNEREKIASQSEVITSPAKKYPEFLDVSCRLRDGEEVDYTTLWPKKGAEWSESGGVD